MADGSIWGEMPHLALGAQTGGRRRLGNEAESLEVRLQISAELHLHRLHPLVRWVHRFSCRPVGEEEQEEGNDRCNQ